MTVRHQQTVKTLLEAMPYIRRFWGATVVLKYGGAAMTSPRLQEQFAEDVVLLRLVGMKPIVVHGGGPAISSHMKRLGMRPEFVDGHRVTDEATMEVTDYRVPRLDLSDRPITVTYDRDVQSWPASYVSLFYPAAMEMEMAMGAELTEGAPPPVWARPSDARNSALIEKLNITALGDDSRTAWPLDQAFNDPGIQGGTRSLHPENVGVTLTREERVRLIRAIDLGGQFYSRQNTGFEPMAR